MRRNSLVVLWLGFCASTAEGLGSIPDQGTKIPQVAQPRKNKDILYNTGNIANILY